MKNKEPKYAIFKETNSNFHPYECGGVLEKCEHCLALANNDEEHIKNCALCADSDGHYWDKNGKLKRNLKFRTMKKTIKQTMEEKCLKAIKEKRKNKTKYPIMKYDENGNLIYLKMSVGHWVKRKYDKNKLVYWENSNGYWVKIEYDKNGNEIYQEDNYGHWVKTEYDGNKLVYWENSNGYWKKRKYNKNGNEIYQEDSNGHWVKTEYDKNGNKIYWEDDYGYWGKIERDNIPKFENNEYYLNGEELR